MNNQLSENKNTLIFEVKGALRQKLVKAFKVYRANTFLSDIDSIEEIVLE